MKRTLSILFALALVLAFSLVATTPVAAASTWYVDGTLGMDDGSHGGGSGASAFKTIQYAINDSRVGNGDTINVAAGTYNENVVINKTNLTLKSQTALGAIIQPTTSGSNAVYITADGVTVDGFEIDGTTVAKNGILGWETSGLTIKNNKVHGAVNAWDGCGILLFSWGNNGTVYNNLIQDNEVYDTGRMGIFIMDYGPAIYTVTYGNTITGNTVHDVWKMGTEWVDGGGAIQINVGKNCAITNNLVYDVQDGQRGIYMFGSAVGNTITGNTLRNNTIGIQIWISGDQPTPQINWGGETATTPQVHFNNIYNNSSYGAKSTNIQGTTMVLDATCNWWGAASGPGPVGLGSGDKVTGNVTYQPWLTEAYAPQRSVGAPGGTAYFTPNQGSIEDLTAMGPPTPPPAGVTLPYGMFNFTICCFTGSTVTLTITLPGTVPVGTKWYKYNGGAWDALTIGGGGTNVITVTLTDNNPVHDEDPTVGRIVDQGAPGFGEAVGWETYPVSRVRVLLPWIALLAAIAVGGSLLVLRHRRTTT